MEMCYDEVSDLEGVLEMKREMLETVTEEILRIKMDSEETTNASSILGRF